MIFKGGTIRTLDAARPTVESLAVDQDGRIAALGSIDEVQGASGPSAQVIELNGGVLLPSFKDHHLHLLNIGYSLLNARDGGRLFIDLYDAKSIEEIAQRVAQRAASLPEGTWILGQGWSQGAWGSVPLPTHHALSQAAGRHPVFLTRLDGHAAWVNAAALEAAGIDSETPDPPGGSILRLKDGSPSGILLERAAEPVLRHIPLPAAEDVRQAFRLAARALAQRGITEVFDAGFLSPPGIVDMDADLRLHLDRLLAEDKRAPLPLRIHLMVPGPSELIEAILADPDGYRVLSPRIDVTHLKLFADGAMGSRGAFLSHPFHDDPSTTGVPRMSREEIRSLAARALQAGFDVATHAIGDAAVARTLDVYEEILRQDPALDPARLRIEHYSYASDEDFQRAADLGIVLSVQPGFVIPSDEGVTMEDARVGPDRAARAYAWERLRGLGASLALGSDDFAAPSPALMALYAAATRCNASGKPETGWHPDQRIPREQALRLATSLYPPGGGQPRSGLSAGDAADLVWLSADPLEVPESEILKIQVRATWLNGRLTHSLPSLNLAH